MVAAADAVFVNVSAQLLLVLEVILVDEHVLGLRKRGAGEAGGLDVDVPTGQALWPSLPMASDSWSSGTMTVA